MPTAAPVHPPADAHGALGDAFRAVGRRMLGDATGVSAYDALTDEEIDELREEMEEIDDRHSAAIIAAVVAVSAVAAEILREDPSIPALVLSQQQDAVRGTARGLGREAVARWNANVYGGMSHDEALEDVVEWLDAVSPGRARRIVDAWYGRASEIRLVRAGADRYVWHTMLDDRVRPTHAAQEGETFYWAEPPPTGPPGSEINCRCAAGAVFDDDEDEDRSRPMRNGVVHRLRPRAEEDGGRRRNARLPEDGLLIRARRTPLSLREDDDTGIVTGYAYRWGDVYDAGWFTESISKGAFEASIPGTRLLLGHDARGLVYARVPSTMEMAEDDEGLAFEARLDLNAPAPRSLYSAIDRGDMDGVSVGFWPLVETVDREADPTHYQVEELDLVEHSIVAFPAYEQTSVEARGVASAEETNYLREVAERRLRILDIGQGR